MLKRAHVVYVTQLFSQHEHRTSHVRMMGLSPPLALQLILPATRATRARHTRYTRYDRVLLTHSSCCNAFSL